MAWFIGAQSDLIFVINWDGDMDDRQWLLIWLDMWSNKTSYVACPLVRRHVLHCDSNRKKRKASVASISTSNSPPTMTGIFVTVSQLVGVGVSADRKV